MPKDCFTVKNFRIDNNEISVSFRESIKAKRLLLSIDARKGIPKIVVPKGSTKSEVDLFLDKEASWILQKLKELPQPTLFENGTKVPVMGTCCKIVHLPLLPLTVQREGNEIIVGGQHQELKNKITRWLMDISHEKVKELAEKKAHQVNGQISSVKVRDPQTRWGSCSNKGNLSFSWRLVLAPPSVMDYVVSHEVAHLKEFDHGARFWKLVSHLCPGYKRPRSWLSKYGSKLLRYG